MKIAPPLVALVALSATAFTAPAHATRTSYIAVINANGSLGSKNSDATASSQTGSGNYNVTFGHVTNTTFCAAFAMPTLGNYAYVSTLVHNGNQVDVELTSPAGQPTSLPFYIELTC